jgi:hypothetical protein
MVLADGATRPVRLDPHFASNPAGLRAPRVFFFREQQSTRPRNRLMLC